MDRFLISMRALFGGLGYSIRGDAAHFPHLVAARCFVEEDEAEQADQVGLLVEIALKESQQGGTYSIRREKTTESGVPNWWHFYVVVTPNATDRRITRVPHA